MTATTPKFVRCALAVACAVLAVGISCIRAEATMWPRAPLRGDVTVASFEPSTGEATLSFTGYLTPGIEIVAVAAYVAGESWVVPESGIDRKVDNEVAWSVSARLALEDFLRIGFLIKYREEGGRLQEWAVAQSFASEGGRYVPAEAGGYFDWYAATAPERGQSPRSQRTIPESVGISGRRAKKSPRGLGVLLHGSVGRDPARRH